MLSARDPDILMEVVINVLSVKIEDLRLKNAGIVAERGKNEKRKSKR